MKNTQLCDLQIQSYRHYALYKYINLHRYTHPSC